MSGCGGRGEDAFGKASFGELGKVPGTRPFSAVMLLLMVQNRSFGSISAAEAWADGIPKANSDPAQTVAS